MKEVSDRRERIVVVGAGWAGLAACFAASSRGPETVLLERTDQCLGTGLVGGIMRNNGRFTAAEEAIAMGAKSVFEVADSLSRHVGLDFPGHKHASLYDTCKVEAAARRLLDSLGVQVLYETRAVNVLTEHSSMCPKRIVKSILTEHGEELSGGAFIDATGSAGPQKNCQKFGHGCAMCVLRCASFGPRVGIVGKAGGVEVVATNTLGTFGSLSGSCKILKGSLADWVSDELNENGVVLIPIPAKFKVKEEKLIKACQQYDLPEYYENMVLLDTGEAKLMMSYFPLPKLRQIPGFEDAIYVDPYAGGRGNSVRHVSIALRNACLQVDGFENLFCCGEKSGPLVGHTEAIVTGLVAGYNAASCVRGEKMLVMPTFTAIGDFIKVTGEASRIQDHLASRYTFSGSVYFDRMNTLGLYTTDTGAIQQRVEEAGLSQIFLRGSGS
jgi:hypothetical protein